MAASARKWRLVGTVASGAVLFLCTSGLRPVEAQGLKTRYEHMAPVAQYLMARTAEVALARSAAPASISSHATVLVLGRHGYETAVTGTNGFVCIVERGWDSAFDAPEFWNPKIRGADCLNPQAARSILPIVKLRTDLVMSGHSRQDIVGRIRTALSKGELPGLEPGAMSYMMGAGSYLTDDGDHNLPHLMFFVPVADAAAWGAGLPGSPVGSGPYWFVSASPREREGLPPIRVFIVRVAKWSDGSVAH
jgi:hypothetical protein